MKENKYIRIVEIESTGKTRQFEIINKNGDYDIGTIEWYSSWRQYCLFPAYNMAFNNTCLQLIIDFLNEINKEHKEGWNQKLKNN